MNGMSVSDPKYVRENIARANSYLRRSELVRALEAASLALNMVSQVKLMGTARFEIEVGLDELLMEISRHPHVKALLPTASNGQPVMFKFVKGKERLFATALGRMAEAFRRAREEEEQRLFQQVDATRQKLLNQGQECLNTGDVAKARIAFRRCIEDFGKQSATLYADVATRYKNANLLPEAAEVYEMGMEAFPREAACYASCIDVYTALRDFEKTEHLYERVLRQFGVHPRTLLNMANFYFSWRRKEKAVELAVRVLKIDPLFTEAQDLIDAIDGKK